ncbi:MAG: hypothetical protein RIC57_13865 [Balneola sp.]
MNKFYKIFLLLIVTGLISYSCDGIEDSLVDDQLEENPLPSTPEYSSGSTDFSNYVAIGNSLTAGLMDGALYNIGQRNSVAAILATSFAATVDGDYTFNQPAIDSENGFNIGISPNPSNGITFGRFKLDTDARIPSPVINGEAPTAYTGPALNNFGVPGVTVGQLRSPTTANNPFYGRFASNPGASTVLGDAINADPTFFSLWIGSNDVLDYARGGASNSAALTSNADFQTRFTNVVTDLMTETTADGVVINIPSFLGLAFFRAVPYNPIPLDAATANAVTQGYSDYNNGVQQAATAGAITQAEADRRMISFAAGANAFVMEDETLTDLSAFGLPPLRQSEPTDLTILSLGSLLGVDAFGEGAYGLQDAVSDQFVLIPSEQVEIETSRQTFNGIMAQIVAANSSRLTLYDTNSSTGVFADLFGLSDGVPGITVDGVDLTPDFAPTGVLSTDGIHPNPRGNALIVNEIIATIEAQFGASLPDINVLNRSSVSVCAGNCLSQQ